uniref:Ammonium transporter AmtB-like domain-containing protein n=1 Tax=Panagrolaimus sp. JU765 TaxID=591449 RepID=A0AC34R4U2_9BILA
MVKKSFFGEHQFTFLVIFFHVIFIALFGFFGKYDSTAMPGGSSNKEYVNSKYPMFQDVHVMIFIGFGFLMTFLRRYGYSAVSVNLLLASFTIEWSILIRGFLSHDFSETRTFPINLDSLLVADFAAAVVLITMGSLLGKLTPSQYLLMAFFETPAALITEHFIVHNMKVNDVGGSIIVHAFGAYFGLAASRVLYRPYWKNTERANSIYHSDLFSMIGAVFLWIYWPSFNAVVADPEDARQRAVINTYLSLIACTITTFLVSQLVHKHKHFDMVHIANSTLAGGVAIGTTANVVLSPFHALALGTIAGILSVVGFQYITPMLDKKFKIQDTCGVNNLHGMPGILAALASVVFLMIYDPKDYGDSLTTIYPAFKNDENSDGRTAFDQALYQLAGIGMAMLVSIITGALTGAILRLPIWEQIREKDLYTENNYFHVPEDYDFITDVTTKVDHVELVDHEKPLTSNH